jgi:hypothetical protein
MSGEKDLETLLATMSAKLDDGHYVFVTLGDHAVPSNLAPRMVFRESEGTTLIVLKSEAEAHGMAYEFPCRMITLNVHSSLDAVGFIARIATEVARENMGVNPVSGFFHDHLFVPEGREADALRILQRMVSKAT